MAAAASQLSRSALLYCTPPSASASGTLPTIAVEDASVGDCGDCCCDCVAVARGGRVSGRSIGDAVGNRRIAGERSRASRLGLPLMAEAEPATCMRTPADGRRHDMRLGERFTAETAAAG